MILRAIGRVYAQRSGLKLPLYIEAGPGIDVREGLVGGTGLEPVTSAV